MNLKIILFFFSLLFTTTLSAQNFVIKSKAYLDVESGKMIIGKYIYIKNKKIEKILNKLSTKHYKLINLSDYYLMPGLIDCHSHVFMTQTIKDINFEDALVREAQLSNSERTFRAIGFLKQYLDEGFTSVCDLGNSGFFLDAKLKKNISNNNDYPNFFISGPGIATIKGQFRKNADEKMVQKEYSIINNKTNIEQLLQLYLKHNVDILKVYLDNSPGIGGMDSMLLRKLLSNKNISHFKKVTFHSIMPLQSKLIDEFKIQNIEHFNYFTSSPNEQYKTVKFATMTALDEETLKRFNFYNKIEFMAQLFTIKALAKNNTLQVFGPDFYFHENKKEFNRASFVKKSISPLIQAGLSPIQIIRSMTINPAKSLKINSYLGEIKNKYQASLIATKDNPLENINAIRKVDFVMNRGKIIWPRNHHE